MDNKNYNYQNITIHVDEFIPKENDTNGCKHLLPSPTYPPCFLINKGSMDMPVDYASSWPWSECVGGTA